MNISEIAKSFSEGRFIETYPYIADHAIWFVVGQESYYGKQAITQQCNKVSAYFDTVTTAFTTLNLILQDNQVAVTGTAEFYKKQQLSSRVSACDIYTFEASGMIKTITSYCITHE